MRITEEAGEAQAIQKEMERFQGTGVWLEGVLKCCMLCEFARIFKCGKRNGS